MNELIESLAAQMNVSKSDVKMFAQSMANSLIEDKVNPELLLGEDGQKIIEAYAMAAVKKIQSFTNTYLSNPAARSAFIEAVKP